MNDEAEEVIATAHEWDRAMVRNDTRAIGRYMADDWTIIGSDGSIGDKAGFLALVESGTLSHDVMESEEMNVRVYGDTAVVTSRGVSGGQSPRESLSRTGECVLRVRPAGRALEVCADASLTHCREPVVRFDEHRPYCGKY